MGIKDLLTGGVVEAASGAFQARTLRKRDERIATIEADSKRLADNAKALRDGRDHDANWELASIKNSSWKDEMWAVLFAMMVSASFLPWTQEYAQKGIDQISGYPPWFQFIFGSVVLASYGIRYARRKGW